MFTVGISTGTILLKRKLNYDLPSGQQLYIVSVRAEVGVALDKRGGVNQL